MRPWCGQIQAAAVQVSLLWGMCSMLQRRNAILGPGACAGGEQQCVIAQRGVVLQDAQGRRMRSLRVLLDVQRLPAAGPVGVCDRPGSAAGTGAYCRHTALACGHPDMQRLCWVQPMCLQWQKRQDRLRFECPGMLCSLYTQPVCLRAVARPAFQKVKVCWH